MSQLIVRSLGQQPYTRIWEAMKAFTLSRDKQSPDELWCLEHPPVYTQGQAGKAEHILDPGDIPVIQADRGGQVTYHGPGQLVIYLMIDLARAGLGVRALVDVIEQAIVTVLAEQGIEAAPRPDAPGVYVQGAKVASLGLRVRKGCSFHGLALNVAMDLEPFRRINPCGYAGMHVCQMQDYIPGIGVEEVSRRLVAGLAGRLAHEDVQYVAGLPHASTTP